MMKGMGMRDEDTEAELQALEELGQFARRGMDGEAAGRYGMGGEQSPGEDVPGAEPEEGAEMCDPASCDGMAGEDGMCAKCGHMKPEEGAEVPQAGGPPPEKLKAALASMRAGQGA